MKYINRSYKGTYGYIRKQLIFEMVKTVILYAMAFGIFFIGYFSLHTKKSLWSVLAVLALLPACRSLVGVIMLARFRSLKPSEYETYSSAVLNIPVLYENIFTTKDCAYYVPVMVFAAGTLTAYCNYDNAKCASLKEHLENVTKSAGHKVNVKIFENKEAFLERMDQIREKFPDEKGNYAAVFETIKAVSL